METRSNKRKRALMANPYQRTFIPRVRTNPLNKNRNPVNNLRSRRVFSPSSISDVNCSSEEAEKVVNFNDNNKEKNSDLGFEGGKNGGRIEIEVEGKRVGIDENKGKLDLGFVDGEGSEIEIREIGVFSEDKVLDESNEKLVVCQEDRVIDGNVQQMDCSVLVCEGDEQIKSKINRLGAPLVPCSRKKVYKNPSSFSYRRMLPYLMDLAKDDSNSLELHPCQKVQKTSEERLIPSLSAPQDIPTDGTNKEDFTKGHPSGGLNTDPNPLNAECSNMISPENQITEPIIVETHETPILPTADPLNNELPHILGEIVSESREDMPERSIKSHDSCTVHKTNLPVKSSFSLVTPQSLCVKVGTENAKPGEKNGGTSEVENYENEQIQSTPPDSDIFCKPRPHMSKNGSLECQLSNAGHYDKKRLVGDITNSNSRAKLGTLTPSSRMKLYRTPGSFSYRRLLPYLMDLAKHDTNALATQPCKIIDNIIYEEPSSLPASQEMLEDGPAPETLPILESTKTNPPGSECINLGSNEDHPVLELSVHTDVESLSQIEKQPLPMNESIYTEPTQNETNLLIKSPPSLVIPEPDMNSPEELSFTQEPSSSAPLYSPKETMSTPSPERAFEFSRNQMEDSQEIAMELVKELSSIRALLEKSVNGAECHIVLPVSKVNEACMKALKAEELAKSHLKEMKQELHFHCRTPGVPRPRVRFAEKSQMQLAMEEDSQANSLVNEMKHT